MTASTDTARDREPGLVEALRLDAEMLRGGHQRNLTKLWHSQVVKDAAKDCDEAATALSEALAVIEEARLQLEYMDERSPSGTTPAVITRLTAFLAQHGAGK